MIGTKLEDSALIFAESHPALAPPALAAAYVLATAGIVATDSARNNLTPSRTRPSMTQSHYRDGRNSAKFRMEASDQGVVFEYGQGPGGCDHLGAREAWVFEHEGLYHMTYDGAGRHAWLVCLATSTDLVQWERHGPIIACGAPGSPDSATASYGTVSKHGDKWHMFYLGSPNVTPAPNFIP